VDDYMPELPEVETTRRGSEPHLVGATIDSLVLRTAKLRWPLDPAMAAAIAGQTIQAVQRRAKYLLIRLDSTTLLLHLGMSGALRLVPFGTPAGKHDHVDLLLASGLVLRLQDPRKFGALLWVSGDPLQHPLLSRLGPEPLSAEFSGAYLKRVAAGRRLAVKPLIMDQQVVVGVGNIYASEALFRSGIRPTLAAGRLTLKRWTQLVRDIQLVLEQAIAAGGTTLQDFHQSDGRPGYFRQQLLVYGRAGEPCTVCHEPIEQLRLGQRSTFFCRRCQK
jgi:formamidopyrimidine-DNA glycosylase